MKKTFKGFFKATGLVWYALVLSLILIGFSGTSEARSYYHSCEYPDRQTGLTALACNVYFEARGESKAGKMAVALTTFNRVKSRRFPNSFVKVVYQPKQFSWYNDGLSDRITDLRSWNDALHISVYVLGVEDKEYPYIDITDGSLFYHTINIKPDWADKNNIIVRIDNHLFYKEDIKR